MTEAEWLACESPSMMLWFVGETASDRKLRLLGAAACRRIWSLMLDPRCRQAVEASERYAENLISEHTLDLLSAATEEAYEDACSEPDSKESETAQNVAYAASYLSSPSLLLMVLEDGLFAIRDVGLAGNDAEGSAQVDLVREIFGNPFHPIAFTVEWRTPTVMQLAKHIYEARDFSTMPILADALQDAGCDNADILSHCRDTSAPHVRGCWVVELVLGK